MTITANSLWKLFKPLQIKWIKFNMALFKVWNHYMIIYNKVLDNRVRLVHHLSTYKIPWFYYKALQKNQQATWESYCVSNYDKLLSKQGLLNI